MAKPYPKKGMPAKKLKQAIKRTPIKKKRVEKERNLMDLFVRIWTERKPGSQFVKREYMSMEEWYEHTKQYRVCCVTYKPIKNMVPGSFAHVLTRNHTRYREKDFNVVLLSYYYDTNVHGCFDHGTKMDFLKLGPGAKYLLEYQQFLKQQYEHEKNSIF